MVCLGTGRTNRTKLNTVPIKNIFKNIVPCFALKWLNTLAIKKFF